MAKNLFSIENMIAFCEASVITPEWKKAAHAIGGSEESIYKWRTKSMADEREGIKQKSKYWFSWREKFRYFHEHVHYARREAILRYESIIATSA
jgi:hypothetical protein